MGIPVDVDGVWKDAKPYVNDNGTWKEAQFAYANVNGTWKQVFANFNKATGGTITDVDNYNGTGQKWRVHAFTSNSTFTVQQNPQPFEVLVVGGGGHGGKGGWNGVQGDPKRGGGGGNGGGFNRKSGVTLDATSYSVTVGGGTCKIGPYSAGQGSGGGTGSGAHGSPGSPTYNTITGSNVAYRQGGATGNGWPDGNGANGAGRGGGGGGGQFATASKDNLSGNAGKAGIVVVAYRVG